MDIISYETGMGLLTLTAVLCWVGVETHWNHKADFYVQFYNHMSLSHDSIIFSYFPILIGYLVIFRHNYHNIFSNNRLRLTNNIFEIYPVKQSSEFHSCRLNQIQFTDWNNRGVCPLTVLGCLNSYKLCSEQLD